MQAASPSTRHAARPTFWKRLWAGRLAYLFLLPTFVLLAYFAYYPAYIALTRAFTDWDGFNPPIFTGLENFRRALGDPAMGQASVNVGLWIGLGLLLAVIPPLVVAELIFHLRGPKRQYAYRTLFVVPIVVPSLVLLLLWTTFYRTDGVLNQLLGFVGLGGWQRSWLADQDTALYALIFLGFPYVDAFYLLLLYAGLQSIPKDVLEAAKLDGAVGARRVWTIDLPLLRPQLFLIAVLSVIGNAQYFLSPLVITSGGPGYATTVPALLMYNIAVKFGEYGYALSIAALLFVVIVLLTLVAQRVRRARGD